MAILRRIDQDEQRVIHGDTLVGRSSACSLRLDTTDVSKEHAALNWTGGGWSIRDLNSRNGTFVDGKRLGPADKVTLAVGTQVSFGAGERWVCVDLSAPLLRAKTIDSQPTLELNGEQLLTFGEIGGDDDDAGLDATISRDIQGRWVLERDNEVLFVRNEDELEIGGRRWRVELPEHSTTTEVSRGVLSVFNTELRFVAPPEHPVQLFASVADRVINLKRRGHHHLTLALARVRLADQQAGRDELEAGWITHRRAQELLECTRNLVNVNVHRARKQLEEIGFVDAPCLIERRQTSGKMRIGVSKIDIQAGA